MLNKQEIKDFLKSQDAYDPIFDKAIEMLVETVEQYELSTELIKEQEKRMKGTGYIREYKTGYANISPEMVMQRDSIANFLKLSRKFGLTPDDFKTIGLQKSKKSIVDEFKKMKKVV